MYFFLRYGMVSVLFVGWLLYQLLAKRKKWSDVSSDAITIAFFIGVWCLIAYWVFK